MKLTLRFHTAMLLAGFEASRAGKISREELAAVVDCCQDHDCETCANCETVAISAAQDSSLLTAEQAANPKAINWAGLEQFVLAILAMLLPYIVPPKPTPTPPTPTVPAGGGDGKEGGASG